MSNRNPKSSGSNKNLELLQVAIELLNSGDSDIEGVVDVGQDEYYRMRQLVHEMTGVWHGRVEPPDDDEEDSELENE